MGEEGSDDLDDKAEAGVADTSDNCRGRLPAYLVIGEAPCMDKELERGKMVAPHLGGESSGGIKLFKPAGCDVISPAVIFMTRARLHGDSGVPPISITAKLDSLETLKSSVPSDPTFKPF
jgi:hypothetical protein